MSTKRPIVSYFSMSDDPPSLTCTPSKSQTPRFCILQDWSVGPLAIKGHHLTLFCVWMNQLSTNNFARAVQQKIADCVRAFVTFTFCVLMMPTSAHAEVVLFDSLSNTNTAYFADVGRSQQQLFDDFSISTGDPTNVNMAVWHGVYATGNAANPDDFTIQFYSNSGTVPGSLISSQSVAVSRQVTGTLTLGGNSWDIYEYSANFADVNLTTSDTYWMSVFNDTSQGWAWAADTTQGRMAYSPANSNNRFNVNSQLQFQILSTPEPASFIMFGIVAACGVTRRRR